MNKSPVSHAVYRTLRQWPAFLLVILSLPILLALGFCSDVLFHRWRTTVLHDLGNKPLPPLSEFLDIQFEGETFIYIFLSFAALLFLWLFALLVFAADESRLQLTFIYGFIVIWLTAISFLAFLSFAASLPFVVGLQRTSPPGQLLAPLAPTLFHTLLFTVGAVSLFGIVRLAWKHFHARSRNSA